MPGPFLSREVRRPEDAHAALRRRRVAPARRTNRSGVPAPHADGNTPRRAHRSARSRSSRSQPKARRGSLGCQWSALVAASHWMRWTCSPCVHAKAQANVKRGEQREVRHSRSRRSSLRPPQCFCYTTEYTTEVGLHNGDHLLPHHKAAGGSATHPPNGDSFNAHLVAHEIGHQFGIGHTFAGIGGSCTPGNFNPSQGVELAGGRTTLSYAGVCASAAAYNSASTSR